MQITVFGASGMVGKAVCMQLLTNGYTVKAFSRNIDEWIDFDIHQNNFSIEKGFLFDASDVYNALKGSQAVVSCIGGGTETTDKTRSLGIKNIIAQMQKAGLQNIVAIGGAGILLNEKEQMFFEDPEYTEAYKYVSEEHQQAFEYLSQSGLKFNFFCPPFIKNEKSTSTYLTKTTYQPQTNTEFVAINHLVDAMVLSIKNNQYLNQKIGICTV